MSAPSKPSGGILKNYEIILLVIAITMIIIVRIQRPAVPVLKGMNQKALKISK